MPEPPYRFDPWQNIVNVGWSDQDTILLDIFFRIQSNKTPFPVFKFSRLPFTSSKYDIFTPNLVLADGFRPIPPVEIPDDFPDELYEPDMTSHLYLWGYETEVEVPAGGDYRRSFGFITVNISKLLAEFPNPNEWIEFDIEVPAPSGPNTILRNNWVVRLPAGFIGDPPQLIFNERIVRFTDDPNVPPRQWYDLVGFPDLVVGNYPVSIHGSGADAQAFYNAHHPPGSVEFTHQTFYVDDGTQTTTWAARSTLYKQADDVYVEIDETFVQSFDIGLVDNPNPVTVIQFRIKADEILKPRQNSAPGG